MGDGFGLGRVLTEELRDVVLLSKPAALIASNTVRLRSGQLVPPPRSGWPLLALIAFHPNAGRSHLCHGGPDITATR